MWKTNNFNLKIELLQLSNQLKKKPLFDFCRYILPIIRNWIGFSPLFQKRQKDTPFLIISFSTFNSVTRSFKVFSFKNQFYFTCHLSSQIWELVRIIEDIMEAICLFKIKNQKSEIIVILSGEFFLFAFRSDLVSFR